jgi:hypothetical protein
MSDINKLKKEEVVGLAESLQAELEQKNSELESVKNDFNSQMEEMKKMIASIMENNAKPKEQKITTDEEPTVTVTCYLLGKNHISLDKESTVLFECCGSEEELTYAEVKDMIKFGKNKSLFSDGLLVLNEQEAYDKFKIKPRKKMTDEYIASVFGLSVSDFLMEVDTITNNKTSNPATHSFVYRSAYLYKKGLIRGLTKDISDTFKDYFGKNISDIYIDDDIL